MRIVVGCVIFFVTLLMQGCIGNKDYQLLQTDRNMTQKHVKHTSRSIEYRILPQDRLEISLYKDPDQNVLAQASELGQSIHKGGLLVNASGYVSLPLVGKVKVAGFTQSRAASLITHRYKKYINTPSVYLEVLNKRLFVLGEVKNPGVVKIDKEKMTLFEALAFAGDVTDSAQRTNIVVLSANTKGKMNIRHIDLTQFDGMNYSNMMLRPNDIVYVRPNSWKAFRVASDDYTSVFKAINTVLSPFITWQYLKK